MWPSIVTTPVRSVGPYFRACVADQHNPFLCWCQRHRLLRLLPSKFPVSYSESRDHMRAGARSSMITDGSARRKERFMTGRKTIMVLATALLAGSLLATGAQAHGGGGGGGGGGGHGGGGFAGGGFHG